jgi:hypothetical protein
MSNAVCHEIRNFFMWLLYACLAFHGQLKQNNYLCHYKKKQSHEILSVFLYMSRKYIRGKFRQANVRSIVIDICVTLKISHYFIASPWISF